MKKAIITVSIFLGASSLFLIFCEGSLDLIKPRDTIYYNSFEKESDLADWEGLTIENLVDDSSPNGGNKSIRIAGGCVWPHAALTLASQGEDILVSIQCYGKDLLSGGEVELYVGSNFADGARILVSGPNWTFYKGDKSLLWSEDSTLNIWLSSGGFTPSAMLIDELRIVEVK